jgi:hypothetical protein
LFDRARIVAQPAFNRWVLPLAALATAGGSGAGIGFCGFSGPVIHAWFAGRTVDRLLCLYDVAQRREDILVAYLWAR